LITDDETATGNTLCQTITNLNKHGAKDIAVVVVHNNMPLDWLLRQLCLAKFLYMGVNDLHFSDTQEMGTLATSYDDMIHTYAQKSLLPRDVVAKQAFAWFKENICKQFTDQSDEHINQEFAQFNSMFSQFQSRIKVHSLANEFAQQVKCKHSKVQVAENTSRDITSLQPATRQTAYAAEHGGLLFSPKQSRSMQRKDAQSAAMQMKIH
jgi:hypothetical protein